MENNNFQIISQDQEERSISINFRQLFSICLSKWYWFLISCVFFVLAAGLYILKTRPIYSTSATILIKEASARRMATSDIESVMNFSGGASMSSKVVNEVIAFKSPALMQSVVERMDLMTEYSDQGFLRTNILYGSSVPVNVTFADIPSDVSAVFELAPSGGQICRLGKLEYWKKKEKVKVSGTVDVAYGDTVSTAIGKIVVVPNKYYTGKWKKNIKVSRISKAAASAMFVSRFKADQEDVKNHSDVLRITLSDYSVQRANDILNMMIVIYNENWVEDKNKMAISTTNFIDERLASLESELGVVDQDISTYKSANLIPEGINNSSIYINQNVDNIRLSREIDNQLYICRYLKNFLFSQKDPDQLIPVAAGMENSGLSNQINEYNKLILAKNNVEAASSGKNPIVEDLDSNIASLRTAIENTVNNQIVTMEAQLANLKQKENQVNGKIASSPVHAKYLTTIGRQQKVKESLYLYLLQKREENELSQAFTAYNTRIITPPMGVPIPISPKSRMIVLFALFLGLGIPFCIIFFRLVTDNKIRERKDISTLSLPFLGEVPQFSYEEKKSLVSKIRDRKSGVEKTVMAVGEGKRDAVNEAFRVLRTNLEFMTKGAAHNVIILTSFNPGSGKTFLSMNIAEALAIKKKSVLVIDGDLRHASSSKYVDSPRKGLVNYLNGETDDVNALLKVREGCHFAVLPVGMTPPNPSELISEPRFAELVGKMKERYDYVFIDCPPVDIVADTQIIGEIAEKTIFVARAGLMEKNMVPGLQKFYDEKRFPNLCLILNGTEESFRGGYGNYYGSYRYDKNYYSKA